MSYRFYQNSLQSGQPGGFLMVALDNMGAPQLRRKTERDGFLDVQFEGLSEFCKYLEDQYYKNGNTIFYEELHDSIVVYSTDTHRPSREISEIGEFQEVLT